MEFHPLPVLAFLCLALTTSHAVLPSEVYWNSMLPNIPMPKAIRDVLRPDLVEDKSSSVDEGKGGVNVIAGKEKPGGGTNIGVRKGGVSVNTGNKGKPVQVRLPYVPKLFGYRSYDGTGDELHADPTVVIFFLEKDMRPGTKMNLHFTKDTNEATFLPQSEHQMIFSSEKLPEILKHFSVKPESVEARIIKNTIKECEAPGIKGEEKYCATSLESMIDFSISKLGKRVQAISTEVVKETQKQKYTIVAAVKKMAGDESVVCHKLSYPYAVFYCHKTQATRAYMVPMVGADGSKVKAVAVCHTDTSAWNPKYLAFQELKVKPGTVPICHFLPEDHVIWVPK